MDFYSSISLGHVNFHMSVNQKSYLVCEKCILNASSCSQNPKNVQQMKEIHIKALQQ